MGGQDDLQRAGIGSYLMAFSCERQAYSGFDSIKIDLQRLGRVLGREKEADAAVARIDATLAQVKSLPPLPWKPVIFYLDSQSDTLMSQGKKGFMTEVITLARGENVFIDMPMAGIHVSPETLLDKQPDYIILADAVWSPAEKKKPGWQIIRRCLTWKLSKTDVTLLFRSAAFIPTSKAWMCC